MKKKKERKKSGWLSRPLAKIGVAGHPMVAKALLSLFFFFIFYFYFLLYSATCQPHQ